MKMKKIIVAGGCFWGVEAYFSQVKGILDTQVGYIDGRKGNPSYEDVCDSSGHAEAVYLEYDEKVLPIHKLLEHYFNIIDPFSLNRQGNDVGVQYRTAIYYMHVEDAIEAKKFVEELQKKHDKPIQVQLKAAGKFWRAEEYHQQYLTKNPGGYCHIDLTKVNNIK